MSLKVTLSVLFVSLLIFTVHCQDGDDVEKTTKSTTTTASTTTTTTVTPPTTKSTTTVTTTKSTSTTQSTSTATTPTTKSTTTAKPTPAPPKKVPETFNYTVIGKKNVHCIVMKVGIRLVFNYTTSNAKVNKTAVIDVVQPKSNPWNKYNGTCGNDTQTITIPFVENKKNWTVSMTFNRTKNDIVLHSVRVNFTVSKEVFPGAVDLKSYSAFLTNQSMLETPIPQGFRCNNEYCIKGFPSNTPLVNISTYSLEVEAFRTKNDTDLKADYTQCEQDNKISNIVPIAVGAALGALVLIVLIAYLVGRKRNQRGYESV